MDFVDPSKCEFLAIDCLQSKIMPIHLPSTPGEDSRSREILEQIVSFIITKVSPQQILLYGSRARGDHTERSDFDVAVVNPQMERWSELLVDMIESAPTLLKVDLVDLGKTSKMLRERILSEGIVLYESKTKA